MRKRLVITDNTRMRDDRVCVAGCDEDGACIRPVLPRRGIQESSLYSQGQPIVFPFALVEYNLRKPLSQPPHVEDWQYAPGSVRFLGKLEEEERREVLACSLCSDVEAVFDGSILHGPGYYVPAGVGSRSIGTIRPQRVSWTLFDRREDGRWRCLTDGAGAEWMLTVTDLT